MLKGIIDAEKEVEEVLVENKTTARKQKADPLTKKNPKKPKKDDLNTSSSWFDFLEKEEQTKFSKMIES